MLDILVNRVKWQFDCLQEGFWAALPRAQVAEAAATAADLRAMCCGAAADGGDAGGVDIESAFRVVQARRRERFGRPTTPA